MKNVSRLTIASLVLGLSFMYPSLAIADDCEDGTTVHAVLKAQNGSGISGTATVCVTAHAVRGQIYAKNLKPGNAYTLWFFFAENGVSSNPGRFDSTVARQNTATFSGHVGGLRAPSGSTITLEMFDHGQASSDDVTLANNLLTPAGGGPAAQAIINMP
jgi:hypothetical protein